MTRRWVAASFLAAALVAFFALGFGDDLTLAALQQRQAGWQAAVAARPAAALLSYAAVYVAVTALSLPGATVLTLAGGALFGLGVGVAVVSAASTLGALLAFLVARGLLGGWVQARFGARLAELDAAIARDGAFHLFALRLVPVVPFFVVNLLMGLTPIRTATYLWVSWLGMLPATVVYVNAGTRLAELRSVADIASPGLLFALALLGLLPLIAKGTLGGLRRRRLYARWPRPARFERNLVVIGGGSAGLVTAYVAAALHARVTLVEAHRLGGDCLNTGCVPSKALVHAARLAAQARRAAHHGVHAGPVTVDFAAVMGSVQRAIDGVAPHDSAERYRGLGVDVEIGHARLVTPWEIEVTRADGSLRRITSRATVIAAGARPALPAIPGLDRVPVLTSDSLWTLRTLPRRLLVLGGGPMGCELAQAFARLGAQVTLVEQASRLLVREDPEVSTRLAERFVAEGVDLRLGHTAVRVLPGDTATGHALEAVRDGRTLRLAFDALLVASGRAARLTGYGLEELGVATGRTVTVDDWLRTALPNIYAAGDVAGPWQLTHAAGHQGWHAAVNALLAPWWSFRVDARRMPAVVFTEPEVARVGLNVTDAVAQGVAHEVTRYPLADLDRLIADDDTEGFVQVLTAPGSDRILGVTIVGAQAGELLAEFTLAMRHGLGLKKILAAVHPYPTRAEAARAVAGRWQQAHAPAHLLHWAERFHAWRRGAGPPT